MAHDPRNNPTLPGLGGRTRRRVEHSHTVRTFRTDSPAEQRLYTLGAVLRGFEATDTVSVSMLLRRALAVYADHVAAVQATPALIAEEMDRVRQGSVIPSGHRTYAHKPLEKRVQQH
jgi:hypothetical protein